MTTILITFIVAFVLSLIFTPLAKRLGNNFGAIDTPNERKIHTKPIPRTGGLAIFLSVILTLFLSSFFNTNVSNLLFIDKKMLFFLSGGLLCFGIGFFDDFRRLGPKVKVFFQVVAATLAFWGEIHIGHFEIFSVSVEFGYLSYFLTVFWFIFFINAVNLVDGIDGLAGGIVVFAAVIMIILSILKADFLTAMFFAALGGGVLGFLRYNFNPATIFLGDGGSYFLGYTVAALSIMGSVKSQIGAAILIPLLALGVPLFDTILSPLRRFVRGKKIFHPDNDHIHHRLLTLGFSAKKAVLLIYAITAALCISAIILVNVRDEQSGLFLIVLGGGAAFLIRKLGYFNYYGSQTIYRWLNDILDTAGFSRKRRSFLNFQIDLDNSVNLEEVWLNACKAFEWLKFDLAEMKIDNMVGLKREKIRKAFSWRRNGFDNKNDICKEYLLKIELPLLYNGNQLYGTLWLIKDLKMDTISNFTLRRIEHLGGTLMETLAKVETRYRNLQGKNDGFRNVA
jgi:UDP-GlcNAc:undecaprenyl-phosphate GlcNAc-1-phosphate transferase